MTLPAPALPRAEPAYFMSNGRACVRWLHRPAATVAARDVGVVICCPLGYKAQLSHRSLRHLAEESAARGYPTLRFDYDGTGDSAGDDLDADRWEAWLASLRAAVHELQERSGVSRVVLLGVRLGASMAAAAAVDAADVAGAVLIAPIASGRLWLRELRALKATMGRPEGPRAFALPADMQESVGMLITADTKAAIESIDLSSLGSRLPRELLLIDREDRPAHTLLAERWRADGHVVRHAVLPGFAEMMVDPHESEVPSRIIAEVIEWLEASFPGEQPRGLVATELTEALPTQTTLMTAAVAVGVEERLHTFGSGGRLFGVMSVPVGTRPTRAMVLLNSGANSHIGSGRMYVKFARRLAAAGWIVLRYDVSGIGDSLPHAGAPENEVYTPHAVSDLGTALELLRQEHAPERIEVMGICSGGYHGFKGAVAGLPIDGITVVNPLVFFWKPGMSLAYPPFQMVQIAAQYRRSVLQPDKWLKLLRGQVKVGEVARVLMHRFEGRVRGFAREMARALRMPLHEDLAMEVSSIVEGGVALRFIFSAGDPGEALLREGAGRRFAQLTAQGAVTLANLADCDHSLSSSWMHEALWEQFSRGLESR